MSELELKAMLFGFMYGDGWITHIKDEKYNHLNAGFSGDEESLIIVKNDLKKIYKEIGKATINTRNTVSEKYGIVGTTSSFIVNTNIAKDFINLGMPIGKKVEQEFLIPNWIMNGTTKIKSSFISGLYAAEGYTPAMQKNDKTPKVLGFNITKRTIHFENFKLFIEQIATLLKDIGINYNYSFIDTITCDLNKKCIFTFDNSIENLLIVTSVLDIRYCKNKDILFKKLNEYLKYKQNILNVLQNAYELALSYTCSAQEVANKFNITRSQVEKWRNRKTGIRVPNNILTFSDFIKI